MHIVRWRNREVELLIKGPFGPYSVTVYIALSLRSIVTETIRRYTYDRPILLVQGKVILCFRAVPVRDQRRDRRESPCSGAGKFGQWTCIRKVGRRDDAVDKILLMLASSTSRSM